MGAARRSKVASEPTASLTRTLLARKGSATPAMRRPVLGAASAEQDDLGWNDMGASADSLPPVLLEREVLREKLEAPRCDTASIVAVPLAIAEQIDRDVTKKHNARNHKATFTLRLDGERHLRLRLACALSDTSAQALVTRALDHFLQSLPEVEELVCRLPTRAAR